MNDTLTDSTSLANEEMDASETDFDVDDVDPQVMKEVKRIMNERNDKD